MALDRRNLLCTAMGSAMGLAPLAAPVPVWADIVTANCTGMFDLDIYTFDTSLENQDVDGIGPSEFSMDETEILLVGDFGTYHFDLEAGTLYHNDSDTGLYCTYKTTQN